MMWYLQCYAETVPPDAIQTGNNIMQLFSCLPANNRISPIYFTYWDGNYYTAPEFSIDGMRLSPRLDNFYEKIGVKTLGLLYPTVCRLQVPK